MHLNKFSSNAFSFRDYIAYLLPGLVFLGALFVLRPELWINIKSDPIISLIVLLAGGYISGYVSNVITIFTISPFFNKILGDPFRSVIKGKRENKLARPFKDDIFVKTLVKELKDYWGSEIINGDESNILYLCWRDIQRANHHGLDYMFRTVSLWNFSCSMLFSSIIFTIASGIMKDYFLMALAIGLFIVMSISRFRLRREFARNVYRIWFVINHGKSREKKEEVFLD